MMNFEQFAMGAGAALLLTGEPGWRAGRAARAFRDGVGRRGLVGDGVHQGWREEHGQGAAGAVYHL